MIKSSMRRFFFFTIDALNIVAPVKNCSHKYNCHFFARCNLPSEKSLIKRVSFSAICKLPTKLLLRIKSSRCNLYDNFSIISFRKSWSKNICMYGEVRFQFVFNFHFYYNSRKKFFFAKCRKILFLWLKLNSVEI